jgi:hypothetical protein
MPELFVRDSHALVPGECPSVKALSNFDQLAMMPG